MDGELPPERVVEMETHLTDCACCRERVELSQAVRHSLKKVVTETQPSAEFLARVNRALATERTRQDESTRWEERGKPLAWRFIVPVAAAAGFTLVWGAISDESSSSAETTRSATMMSTPAQPAPTMTASVDQLIDELVTYHARAADPQVLEPSQVDKLEPEVGVPVPGPSLQKYGLRWEGASVIPVQQQKQRAASLRYSFDGHRVTLYVYNSQHLPLRATLEPRVVRNTPVYVGSRRGYSIAAVETRGVGYAVATDLDDRESAELVVASVH
jgi:anti-sigma factor RsiW